MKTLLILGHLHDATLPALARLLRERGAVRVECLTDADLIAAPDWRVQLTNDTTDWQLTLADGRHFSAQTTDALYNRLGYLTPLPFASATDTAYAQAEWHALLAGWLQNLGPTRRLGTLFPTTLAVGTANPLLRVRQLALAGLPVADLWVTATPPKQGFTAPAASTAGQWRQETLNHQYNSVLATRQTLTGALARVFRTGIRQLQAQLDCELLQVHFCQSVSGHWKATNYQTLVQPGSEAELAALATYLIERTHAPATHLTPALP
ncbi:hypothetical protein FAES_4241 [Fibrella aestuarina BUZ 2]|uniref:Uncharacterized protein n=1 Tax=Fibrella aestuarina BUZ 2 TaxID=1166018 RepID=I0KDN8_9BACT|nr:hypothetical protein [Fibrella aestuarina]CCH02241.1 hypothetical protein FAES_4241 [Fibrella aestuarina BUZ 2]